MTSAGGDRQAWIADDEPSAFELVNTEGRGRAILVCDHASPVIPRRLGSLGLSPEDRFRHVAWDIGAAEVARRLSGILDAPLALPGYSRLVVDCNRPLHEPDAFTTRSEDVAVTGNLSITDKEKAERIS
jgi:predicted N-formylglutamate amidohydrolase